MKILEGIAELRQKRPGRVRWMVPGYAWDLARPYGVTPKSHEMVPDPERS